MGNQLDHTGTKSARITESKLEWFEEHGYDVNTLTEFIDDAQEKIATLEKIQEKKRKEIAERREELREEKEQLRDEESLYGLS